MTWLPALSRRFGAPGSHASLCKWILLVWLVAAIQMAHAVTTVRVLVPAAYNQDNWATQRNLTTAFAARTGIQVEFVTLAVDFSYGLVWFTTDTASAVHTMFASKDAFVDIFGLDVVWIGDFGEFLLPLDDDASLAATLTHHNPQNVAAGVYRGQLKAVPQNADYGVLYSRMDLLNRYGYSEPPTTYQQMEEMMAKIVPEEKKTNPAFIGLANQVSAYEGLTCNTLEWTLAEDAGVLVEADRTLSTFDQQSPVGQRVVNIGKRMRKWHANGWMPIGYAEQLSAREWVRGNTLFHRNWPYMARYTVDAGVPWPWRLTRLPAGAAALGGWLWGGNKFTRNPEAVKRVLELFGSIEWQRSRAVFEGAPPTIPALFNESQVCSALPICEVVQQLKIARRPSSASGVRYPEVTKVIFTRWFDIVRGIGGSVESLLDAMNRDIARILDIDILGQPTNVSAGNGAVAAFSAIAAIEIIVLVSALAWFMFLNKTPVVHNIGLAFLVPVTVGLVLQLAVVFLTVGPPDSATCHARFWIHGLGYSLAVVSAGMRLFRLWSISLNPFITQRNVPPQTALTVLLPAMCVALAILAGFSASGIIGAHEVKLSKSRYIACTATAAADDVSVFHIVWYGWLGVQMLATFWVGIKASRIATAPPEARALTVCISNAAFFPIILIPFVDLDLVDQATGYILRSLVVVFPVALFIGIYLAPRAWLALEYWRNPTAAAEKDSESQSSMMSSTVTNAGGLATFAATTAAPGGAAGGKAQGGAHHAGPTVQASAVMTIGVSTTSPAGTTTTTGQQAPTLDLKKLVKTTLKEFAFGCEGIVTMRRSDRQWLLSLMPWTLKRGYILPNEQLLVFQHLSNMSSMSHGTCIPMRSVKSVSKTKPNEFSIRLDSGFIHQLMVSSPDETAKWVAAIEAAIRKENGNAGK